MAIPAFAGQDLKVELDISSEKERIVPPKSLLTSIFIVTNSGEKEDTYICEAEIPDNWQVISTLIPFSLLPGGSRIIPLTVSIPITALTSQKYKLSLKAISQTDPSVTAERSVFIEVLPHAQVKIIPPRKSQRAVQGQRLNYVCTVVNLGNGSDVFEIKATSAHGEEVGLSEQRVKLGVGERKEIVVTINIPLDVSPGTSHFLTIKATSLRLEKGVSDEASIYTPIKRRKPQKERIYKTFPTDFEFYLSGLATGNDIGPQVRFNTGGYVDDNYWLNFYYQGPFYKDKENYRGWNEEKITLDFGTDSWDIGLGDTQASLSELTTKSLSEEGARFRVKKDRFSALFFNMDREQSGFQEDIRGCRVTTIVGYDNQFSINYFSSDEEKTDPGAVRQAEDKEIVSISTFNDVEDFSVRAEYAGSRFDDGSGEKEDIAWWVRPIYKTGKVYIDTEYIHAGSDFPGRRSDIDGYRAYLSYRFFTRMWAWILNSSTSNNLKSDPSKATDDKDLIEVGTSFSPKGFPYISLSYQIDETQSKQDVILSDAREESIILRSNEKFGPLNLSLDFKWTDTKDDIKSIDSETSDYTTRVYGRWNKLSAWVGGGYNIDKDMVAGTETTFFRKEAGFVYQPTADLSTYVNFSQEGASGEKDTDILSIEIYYDVWEGASFSLEGEYRNDHSEFSKEWEFWLSFRKSFDLIIPFIKTAGTIEGNVFIDENINGRQEKGEMRVPKITFLLDGNKQNTNRNGRFRFPSIPPGEYDLDIDISSLPVGLASSIELPHKIKIQKGKLIKIDIPLVRVCKVKGVVFEDKNKNTIKDKYEKGLSSVRVLLISKGEIYKDTFSDVDGRYGFTGILPGVYHVSIDEEWLPYRHRLTTVSTYQVKLQPAQEIMNLNFGSVEKERRIIKTYTAPEVETIYPEEKEERPPVLRYIQLLLFVSFLLIGLFIVILLIYKMLG